MRRQSPTQPDVPFIAATLFWPPDSIILGAHWWSSSLQHKFLVTRRHLLYFLV